MRFAGKTQSEGSANQENSIYTYAVNFSRWKMLGERFSLFITRAHYLFFFSISPNQVNGPLNLFK